MRERKHIRLLNHSFVELTDGVTRWVGVLEDVSVDGIHCRVYGEHPAHEQGQIVDCSFVLPTGRVECTVELRWSSPEEIGLQIRKISDEHRKVLTDYCNSPF